MSQSATETTPNPAAPAATPAAPAAPAPTPQDQQPQGTDPVAPENGTSTSAGTTATEAKPAGDEGRTFTQAELNAILAEERRKHADKAAKTVEERVAELEKARIEAENTAKTAIITAAASNAHDPALVAQLLAADVADLTAADADTIREKVAALLNERPYLVKATSSAGPDLTPAPGVTATGTPATPFMSKEKIETITNEELADKDTRELYIKSKVHHGLI